MPREPLLCLMAALIRAANEARQLAMEMRNHRIDPRRLALLAAQLAHDLQQAALVTLSQLEEYRGG